ncbi:MAG: class I SAM-dependent methyltransferase [Armatimonadetes bacterium]|nr:class I SAM-dependent methyltransferase [Armatimonadota bacterium]
MRQNIYDDETFFTGYRALRDTADNFNNLVEQPALRALLPPLGGKVVLDLGCGFGDLAAYCVAQGAARVTATDISTRMLAQARERNALPQIEYVKSAMEDLDFPPASVDLVVSSLALHYVADYAGLVRKVAGWLTAGGDFVFSVEHPICTAQKADQTWLRDEAGRKLCWPVDDYSDEGRREFGWYVPGVIKYHRTVSTLLNGLMEAGLAVAGVQEPVASEETIRRLPEYAATRRVPPFLLVKSNKPEGN